MDREDRGEPDSCPSSPERSDMLHARPLTTRGSQAPVVLTLLLPWSGDGAATSRNPGPKWTREYVSVAHPPLPTYRGLPSRRLEVNPIGESRPSTERWGDLSRVEPS